MLAMMACRLPNTFMMKIILIIACLLCLNGCNQPGKLPGHFALESIHVAKSEGALGVTVAISTTVDLVAELGKLDSVTYGQLICPLGEKDVFYLSDDSGPALVAPVHVMFLPKSGEQRRDPNGKYYYQLAGKFESAETQRTGTRLQAIAIIPLLKKRDTLTCKMVVFRYFRAPYFSNSASLKSADLIMALEKAR